MLGCSNNNLISSSDRIDVFLLISFFLGIFNIFTNSWLSIYIKDYSLTNDDYLFSNCNKEKLCSNAIRKIIKENVELAKKENPNFSDKVNPHKFRHSKATHLINKGVSVVEVKEFLGHVDLSSTQIYITTDLLKKREALKTIEQQLEINNNNSIVGTNEWLDNLIQDSIMWTFSRLIKKKH